MFNIKIKDIVNATGGKLLCGDENVEITNFCTNSSKAAKGLMFLPIIGERVDGHKYIPSAFLYGAEASMTSSYEAVMDMISKWEQNASCKPVVLVEDSVKALQDVARYYEKTLSLMKVGVTGSVGKTTTKEMIACALSASLNVFKTAGNANSQIGVPITLMDIMPENEAAVIEMGMSEEGEMQKLAKLLSLNAVAMTNIGVSHIEQLKTQENILKEKWHITDALSDGGLVFLNGNDKLLRKKAEEEKVKGKFKVYTYGTTPDCDYYAENIKAENDGVTFLAVCEGRQIDVSLKVLGEHNVLNALVAIAVADKFGVSIEKAAKALADYEGVAMRGQVTIKNGVTYIDDSYNASPDSMKAGLNVLTQTKGKRKIAVLADMLELGENTAIYHRQVGEYIANTDVEELIVYGELAKNIADGARKYVKNIHAFTTHKEIIDYLLDTVVCGDVILFKGSRGMKLNEVVEYFLK